VTLDELRRLLDSASTSTAPHVERLTVAVAAISEWRLEDLIARLQGRKNSRDEGDLE
jgi:hypothetical protein